MADNKKYYYMRLKENFFDDDNMIILESMPDGYLYSNILLKLYLRSLKDDGRLMLNGRIPYNPQMLATVTRHQIGTVERALNVFKELGLIEVLDNGAIYMLDIQNYIGQSSTEADRQREYYNRIKNEKALSGETLEKSCKKSNKKSTPELELEKELEKEREREREGELEREQEPERETTVLNPDLSTGEKVRLLIKKYWKRELVYDDALHYLSKVLTEGEEDANKMEMLEIALKLSAQQGEKACNWRYVDAIYAGWVERNITTPEEWLAYEQNRKGGAK